MVTRSRSYCGRPLNRDNGAGLAQGDGARRQAGRRRVAHGLRVLVCCVAVAIAAVALTPWHASAAPAKKRAQAVTFGTVVEKARKLSLQPYVQPTNMIPDFLKKIDYDAWRDIRFRTEKSLWRGTDIPFELQFFHPGFLFDRTVGFHVVDGKKIQPLQGTKTLFSYGKNPFAPQMPEDVGVAGFRIHTPLNTKDYFDEFLVFLGASYLRAVGKGERYGLSARGLAVDTASPTGEEFPWFREFWIVKPDPKDKAVTLYALLDGPRVTGAYSFTARPGVDTVIEVQSAVFLRAPVDKLGIAPLTSMFFLGEITNPRVHDDFRPEVHDSDGLQIAFSSGEWLWRPLDNPAGLRVTSFQGPDIKGFGLMQRDTDFNNYQDLEVHYEMHPSLWIEPVGKWGDGRIELLLIPSDTEINDNVVAYWVPTTMPKPGEMLRRDYVMHWGPAQMFYPVAGHVTATRVTSGSDLTKSRKYDAVDKNLYLFVVDFEGKNIQDIKDGSPVNGVVSAGQGAKVVEQHAMKNALTGGWRLFFKIQLDDTSALERVLPDKRPPVELRAFLVNGPDVVTETWSYLFKP